MKPIVSIVGRPNAGKSTFFNRVTRTRDALVGDLPGVTRDRHYGDAKWDDVQFTLVDTGGFSGGDNGFHGRVQQQVRQAISDADVVISLLDGKSGISPFDAEIRDILRGAEKPVFYAVNKIDGVEQEENLYEFYGLGVEKLYPVSAEHGYGMNDLLDAITEALPAAGRDPELSMPALAVVGRPNVGKSSLINRILGRERLVVSDAPGTTRDAIDSVCTVNGRHYLLIDTAGIRRRGKIAARLEKYSVIKALKSLGRCDIALVVIDAHQGLADQDLHIAGYAYERGRGCIFLLNKWDLVEKNARTAAAYIEQLRAKAKFLNYAPMVTLSAKTGRRVMNIFPLVDKVHGQYTRRLGTGVANRIMNRAVEKKEPPLHRGKRIKFYYTTQARSKPPTFVVFTNNPDAVHFSYERYLINQMRENAGLTDVPIRMIFRHRSGRKDPDAKKALRNPRKTARKRAP